MSLQTEDRQPINHQTPPANADAGKRSHKHWLVLAVALIVVAALLLSGIWSRLRARAELRQKQLKRP